jgi:hypothetical protein
MVVVGIEPETFWIILTTVTDIKNKTYDICQCNDNQLT